jgi:hypothetical protein
VPLDKEQRAITRGEELGFTSREPNEAKERKGEGKGNAWTRPRSEKLEARWGRGVGLAFGTLDRALQGS